MARTVWFRSHQGPCERKKDESITIDVHLKQAVLASWDVRVNEMEFSESNSGPNMNARFADRFPEKFLWRSLTLKSQFSPHSSCAWWWIADCVLVVFSMRQIVPRLLAAPAALHVISISATQRSTHFFRFWDLCLYIVKVKDFLFDWHCRWSKSISDDCWQFTDFFYDWWLMTDDWWLMLMLMLMLMLRRWTY